MISRYFLQYMINILGRAYLLSLMKQSRLRGRDKWFIGGIYWQIMLIVALLLNQKLTTILLFVFSF